MTSTPEQAHSPERAPDASAVTAPATPPAADAATPVAPQPAVPAQSPWYRRLWRAAPPRPAVPMQPPWYRRLWRAAPYLEARIIRYFRDTPPTLRYTLVPLLVLALVLYMRHPATNYIFDEQEALLANPYVNRADGLRLLDFIHRDFWGLPPDASIGSYRPIPSLIWRLTWHISKQPFFHHLYNIVVHALNGALLASFTWAVSKRRALGWLVGGIFVTTAVLTEAVSGIVGIADVLGGLGAILALTALQLRAWAMAPAVFAAVLFGLFSKESALVCVPLVPVAALLTAPMLHPRRPARAVRALLALLAAAGAFVLYVQLRSAWFPSPLPEALTKPLPVDASTASELYRALLVWFHQAPLPNDPMNNPLAEGDFAHRVAGALRVYWRGLGQVVLPLHLSGDYSFPQEPLPRSLFGWETLAGAGMMVGPLGAALGLWLIALRREQGAVAHLVPTGALARALQQAYATITRRPLAMLEAPLVRLERRGWRRRELSAALVAIMAGAAGLGTEIVMLNHGGPGWVQTWPVSAALLVVGVGLLVEAWPSARDPFDAAGPWPWPQIAPPLLALGLVWVVVSYFPHSNIPVPLPTVRAERFWYFPVIGSTLCIGLAWARLGERLRHRTVWGLPLAPLIIGLFLSFQGMQAYRHAMDYRDDLTFWRATMHAVPHSAKAHLNYSVMVGARGRLEERLVESRVAQQLAPRWAMAHIYTGDTLCRLHRAEEGWPHYRRGFELGPNDRGLIALALQCMYDEKILTKHDAELRALGDAHPGSWIAFLATDTLDNHEKYDGVDPQYRPRGYNEGPKK